MKSVSAFVLILLLIGAGLCGCSSPHRIYSAGHPISIVVTASKVAAVQGEVIEVRIEVRNRGETPKIAPDPKWIDIGYEHIPCDGDRFGTVVAYASSSEPVPSLVVEGLSSCYAVKKFEVPSVDGILILRALHLSSIPFPLTVVSWGKKTAEPGATDNLDDAQ